MELFILSSIVAVFITVLVLNILSGIRYKNLKKEVSNANLNFKNCSNTVNQFQFQINRIKSSLETIEEKIDKLEKKN